MSTSLPPYVRLHYDRVPYFSGKKLSFKRAIVLLDDVVANDLLQRSLHIDFAENVYGKVPDAYREYPLVVLNGFLLCPLHEYVWNFYVARQERRARSDNEVIHHRGKLNGRFNKLDNRMISLALLTREQHHRIHEEDRKFRKTKRGDLLGGLWRPRAPSPVKRLDPATIVAAVPRSENKTARTEGMLQRELERKVESALIALQGAVRGEVGHFDSGRKMPKQPEGWSSKSNRRLGIKPIRLGCTVAEAVFFGLWVVKYKCDLDAVVAELGIPGSRAVLSSYTRRPSISRALENWRGFRRLPRHVAHQQSG